MAIVKRGNTYYKRKRQAGRDVQFALKTSDIEEAIRRDKDTEDTDKLPRVADAIDCYEARPEGVRQTDRLYLARIRREIGHVHLVDLSTGVIDTLITQRRLEAGLKPGSVRRELNVFQAALNHARLFGLTKTEIKARKPKVDDARDRWVTKAERDEMIDVASPAQFRAVVAAGFYTGARLGEMLSAKRKDYDEQRGVITFSTLKTGGKGRTYRQVPVHPALKDLLVPNEEWLFPAKMGNRWNTTEFYRHWAVLVRVTGQEGFRPHDMRHTFASLMVQAGVDLITIASITGHKSVTMLNRYAHLDCRSQTTAISAAL